MDLRRVAAILGAGALVFAVVSACKSTASSNANDKVCTPGAYVFCRCKDRSEGTKLCKNDGATFEDCQCGESTTSSGGPPDFTPDASFEVVDSGPPQNPDTSIDAKCVGKLAVVASSAADGLLWGASYTSKGAWTVAKSSGPTSNLRSQPRGALIDTSTLVVVWRTRYDLIGWTKFQANQTALAPAVTVGFAYTSATPDFVNSSSGSMVYLGTANDGLIDTLGEGKYASATGWDDANRAIDGGPPNIPGKSAPVAAVVGTSVTIAFTGTDGSLATQTRSSTGKWGAAKPFAGIKTYEETPAITALVAGAEDLLIVYVGNDLLLHSVSRTTSNQAWGAPILVDTAATSDGAPNLAPMSKGRALLAWKATDGSPFYSVYDPAKNPVWSTPGPIRPNVTVTTPPSVAPGRCAGEVTATYVDNDGNVSLAFFVTGVAGDWLGPYPVPGITKMTFAGAGEVP